VILHNAIFEDDCLFLKCIHKDNREFMQHYHLIKFILFGRNILTITAIVLSLNIFQLQSVEASEPENHFDSSSLIIAQSQQKPKVAVLDFDFSSVSDPGLLSLFSGGSKGVSDILVNKLVRGNSYKVIERSQLEAILQEQNLGAFGRVDTSTAAKIGKILGVKAIIVGSVTQFELEQKSSGLSVFGFGTGGNKTNAYVQLNIRVIDTSTAEILMVADGAGTANQSDKSINILGVSSSSATSNEGKLLTIATNKAIDEVVTALNSNSGQIVASASATPDVEALIADVSGSTIVFNKGSADGYQQGMKLSIERVSKEIKDPQTGRVIRRLTEKVGMVELSDVDNNSSVGQIISGAQFKIGDLAKPVN
jgi:curli biogenesis system outer membrane secretion channel CsgG